MYTSGAYVLLEGGGSVANRGFQLSPTQNLKKGEEKGKRVEKRESAEKRVELE